MAKTASKSKIKAPKTSMKQPQRKRLAKAVKNARPAVRKSAAKQSTAKPQKKSAKYRPEVLDQVLLKMAAKPYAKILKKLAQSKKRLDEERRLAIQLGERILGKAREVRDSLINATRGSRRD